MNTTASCDARPCPGERVCAGPRLCRPRLSSPSPHRSHAATAAPHGRVLGGCPGASTHTAGRAATVVATAVLAHTDSRLLLPHTPEAPLVSRGNNLKRSHWRRIVQGVQSTEVQRCCNVILFSPRSLFFFLFFFYNTHWTDSVSNIFPQILAGSYRPLL